MVEGETIVSNGQLFKWVYEGWKYSFVPPSTRKDRLMDYGVDDSIARRNAHMSYQHDTNREKFTSMIPA